MNTICYVKQFHSEGRSLYTVCSTKNTLCQSEHSFYLSVHQKNRLICTRARLKNGWRDKEKNKKTPRNV